MNTQGYACLNTQTQTHGLAAVTLAVGVTFTVSFTVACTVKEGCLWLYPKSSCVVITSRKLTELVKCYQ